MFPIILSTNNDLPVMAIVIWVIIITIIFFARKFIGRTLFGIAFGILILFFTIFMIDNYTGQNIRNWIDISFYDNTLKDPQGTAQDIIDEATEKGKLANEKINKAGKNLDDSLGIEREGNSGKVWSSDKETQNSDSDKETQDSGADSEKTDTNEYEFIIAYSDIDDFINDTLSNLSKEDKELIKSFSPTVKATIKGKNITVTNEDKDLVKDSKLKITVN